MTYNSEVLADSPLGYWRLGETSGTSAADAGSLASAGTYTNSPTLGVTGLITGDSNLACQFDGTNDYVSIPSNANYYSYGATGITYELLYKGTDAGDSSATGTAGNALLSMNTDSTNKRFVLKFDTSGHVFSLISTTYIGAGPNASGIAVNDGNVHHIAMTVSTTRSVKLYVDGNLEATQGGAINDGQGTPVLTVGAMLRGAAFMSGVIDEVAVYGSALSAIRIAAHAAAVTAGGGGGGGTGGAFRPLARRQMQAKYRAASF